MDKSKYYIGVIGSAKCEGKLAQLAFQTGKLIAEQNWILVCGGMRGVMEEAARGAYDKKGVIIGFLPGRTRSEGNPYLTYALPTGLGHLRNSIVVSASDVIIAIGGGYGTLSEISFANLYNIPVISLNSIELNPQQDLILYEKKACTPQEAVQAVKSILTKKFG